VGGDGLFDRRVHMKGSVQTDKSDCAGNNTVDSRKLHVSAQLLHPGVHAHQHPQPQAGDEFQAMAVEDQLLVTLFNLV
jgi:hypothetical protein